MGSKVEKNSIENENLCFLRIQYLIQTILGVQKELWQSCVQKQTSRNIVPDRHQRLHVAPDAESRCPDVSSHACFRSRSKSKINSPADIYQIKQTNFGTRKSSFLHFRSAKVFQLEARKEILINILPN